MSESERAWERAALACAAAVERFAAADVRPEALAEFVPPRRKFFFTRAARMEPLGEVWRLGPLLLTGGGEVLATGRVVRATKRQHPGYQSESLEERRDLAAIALDSGFEAGRSVNFDAVPIPLDGTIADTGPVGFAEGEVRVRWWQGADLATSPTLEDFLGERAELLINPPRGASN